MLDEERGHEHAHAVWHESSLPELAHGSVDDGVAGPSLSPCGKGLRIVAPGKAGELRPERLGDHGREMLEQMVGEVAPSEFAQIRLGAGFRAPGGARPRSRARHGMPDLIRADLAEMQMGREARGDVEIEPTATLGVAGEVEIGEAYEPRAAASPGCPDVEPFALSLNKFSAFRNTQRRAGRLGCKANSPERGEQAIGLALFGQNSTRAQTAAVRLRCGTPRHWPCTQRGPLARGPHPKVRSLASHGWPRRRSLRAAPRAPLARFLGASRGGRPSCPSPYRARRGCHGATSATRRPCASGPGYRAAGAAFQFRLPRRAPGDR